MRGEFISVWAETWDDIWNVLAANETAPGDLFCELYRELSTSFTAKLTPEQLADVIDDLAKSRETFQAVKAEDFAGERFVVRFFESVHEELFDLGGEELANHYFILLSAFIDKFNLRYDLRRPCALCPTLPGVFASLINELKQTSGRDAHLNALMNAFENSIRDLRLDCSDDRIKTCIQKQVNLLEALGRNCEGVNATTFGAICEEVGAWPHDKLKEAAKSLYTFTCDYPGIRHAGTPANSKRRIDMRDLVAVTILLAGVSPYIVDRLNVISVYGG